MDNQLINTYDDNDNNDNSNNSNKKYDFILDND
jgi:hypothetical protein